MHFRRRFRLKAEVTYFPSAEQEKYWAPSKAVRRVHATDPAQGDKWYIYPTVNHYMHVGVANSPDGPFRLARGEDCFEKPFAPASTLLQGNGREANKLIKHGKYYYLVFSEHKNGIGRYVMAKRDKKLTGEFKEEKQLLLPCRDANEPNQGGIIEGPAASGGNNIHVAGFFVLFAHTVKDCLTSALLLS